MGDDQTRLYCFLCLFCVIVYFVCMLDIVVLGLVGKNVSEMTYFLSGGT